MKSKHQQNPMAGNEPPSTIAVMRMIGVALVLLFETAQAFGGAPTQRLPMENDVEDAAVICVGSAAVKEKGPGDITVQFHVDRFIKGSESPHIAVRFKRGTGFAHQPGQLMFNAAIDERLMPISVIPDQKRCLVFLRRGSDGVFRFFDERICVLNVPNATPDRPIDEPGPKPLIVLKGIMEEATHHGEEAERLLALDALWSLKISNDLEMLARIGAENVSSLAMQRRLIALRLETGDGGGLEDALDLIGRDDVPENQRNEVLRSIGSVRDPRVLHRLGPLLWDGDVRLQEQAVRALQDMKSRAAFPYLRAGLRSENSKVRYHSMYGLFNIASEPRPIMPAVQLFNTAREKFVSAWEEWCRVHAAEYGDIAER